MQKTKSGGLGFTQDAAIPKDKAGASHEAKLEMSMTKEERSLRKPLEPVSG